MGEPQSDGDSDIRRSGGGSVFSVLSPVHPLGPPAVTNMLWLNVQAAFTVLKRSFATKTQFWRPCKPFVPNFKFLLVLQFRTVKPLCHR